MRIVTWNACKGQFNRKVPLLDTFEADLAIVQEIASPSVTSSQVHWYGDNPKQGLAVIARGGYTLRPLPILEGTPKYVVPIAIEGATSFVLFAVWTKANQPMRYVRAAVRSIELYSSHFESNQVAMVGDFNSNAIWNKLHPPEWNHGALVQRLDDRGLTSAYHHFHREIHGLESRHTFYLHWNEAKPYHIDYCFVPRIWAESISNVEIGPCSDWREYSDHRPLIVDVDLRAA
jgi:exonuclease III